MCELYYSVRVRSAVVVYALDGGVLLWRWGSELDGIERWSYSRLLAAARDRVLENHCVGAFKVNCRQGYT